MKITVLTENTTELGLPVEHGLSLFIEIGDRRILFDSGQSDLFAKNAEALGVDLKTVDFAVLSHGHYDHGGGLKKFLEVNGKAKIYMSRYAFEPHFNAEDKYHGLDAELKGESRIVFVDGEITIDSGITVYPCDDSKTIYKIEPYGLKMSKNGKLVPDDFRHEQYLMLEENGKRVLISGCSHRGIMNIEHRFKPDILVGGFHFFKQPLGEKLASYAKILNSADTDYYTCHCTGVEQYKFMKSYMNRLSYISTGQTIEL